MIFRSAAAAYYRMADEARYRPAAPSDGLGNITAPLDQLDVREEAMLYAASYLLQEERMDYPVGCPSSERRAAFIFVIEAARNITGINYPVAARLLRMALEEIEKETDE